jgi:hypothetical protein
VLSQAFYNELRRHPVLIDRAAIRSLTTSPMAIDLYLWLAFRLHQLPKETPISWDKLWRQFGDMAEPWRSSGPPKRSPGSRRPGLRRTGTTVTHEQFGPNSAKGCAIGLIVISTTGLSRIIAV